MPLGQTFAWKGSGFVFVLTSKNVVYDFVSLHNISHNVKNYLEKEQFCFAMEIGINIKSRRRYNNKHSNQNFELCFVLESIRPAHVDSEIYDFPLGVETRRVSTSHLTTQHGVCYSNACPH